MSTHSGEICEAPSIGLFKKRWKTEDQTETAYRVVGDTAAIMQDAVFVGVLLRVTLF